MLFRECFSKHMIVVNRGLLMQKPKPFATLLSKAWGEKPEDNSYYGDPSFVSDEQHGLEHIQRDKLDEEESEKVVIAGYN